MIGGRWEWIGKPNKVELFVLKLGAPCVYMCVFIHICVYTYIHTSICIYTHTHNIYSQQCYGWGGSLLGILE